MAQEGTTSTLTMLIILSTNTYCTHSHLFHSGNFHTGKVEVIVRGFSEGICVSAFCLTHAYICLYLFIHFGSIFSCLLTYQDTE